MRERGREREGVRKREIFIILQSLVLFLCYQFLLLLVSFFVLPVLSFFVSPLPIISHSVPNLTVLRPVLSVLSQSYFGSACAMRRTACEHAKMQRSLSVRICPDLS